jgi:hypothetical protein
LVTDQVNVVDAVSASESVAVTVTELVPAVIGVPEMTPVDELIERPAGRPVAPNVTGLASAVSWGATIVRPPMAEPETLDWVPGLVTDRLSTFQLSVIEPAVPVVAAPPPAPPPTEIVGAVE